LDYEIIASMRRYLPSSFVVPDSKKICLSHSRVNIVGRQTTNNIQPVIVRVEIMSDEDSNAYPVVQPTVGHFKSIGTRVSQSLESVSSVQRQTLGNICVATPTGDMTEALRKELKIFITLPNGISVTMTVRDSDIIGDLKALIS